MDTEGRRLETARAAAAAGGAVALELFRADLDVETKAGPTDLVTRADREAQAAVAATVRERFPDEPVVGEEDESPTSVPSTGPAWVVDPIDGTNNYVGGVPTWATSVASVVDGEPVVAANVAPVAGDTYLGGDRARLNDGPVSVSGTDTLRAATAVPTFWWAHDDRAAYAETCRTLVERFGDVRRFGSAQLTLSYLASGAVDGVVTDLHTNPWDTVAGVHLVRLAGGRVTDRHGDPWRHDSEGLVASNGSDTVHEALLVATDAAVAARDG
jgi:myo-inositol-1(or 4)-monophosphatase